MGPRLRKVALTAHVTSSVGWLGAVVAFLVLALTGLHSGDDQVVRSAYLAMEPITTYALLPFAAASLLTGLVQSLGTSWGLFRHHWVVVKLLLTVVAGAVLLLYTQTINSLVRAAADATVPVADLRGSGMSSAVHASGGLLVLLTTTSLSVFKPRGVTRFGQRAQRRPPKPPRHAHSRRA